MTYGAKMEYLKAIHPRYARATRAQKAKILEEFCVNCSYSRKHAIRVINSFKPYARTKHNKPGTLLKKHIPIKTNQWDETRPGFLEADTVAHCGRSLLGEFIHTVDTVDIATGWTEQRAVFGKGETDVLAQIKDIEASLPFPLLGFDSGNGSEFINWHLMRHFCEKTSSVQFTRSRPYHKNDNAHVEQKNWTHVRQWLGYHRFDKPVIAELMNDLYKNEWRLLHNFFLPSMKLIEKKMIAAKTHKRYDTPKTPHQRVLESKYVTSTQKHALRNLVAGLNPFQLRKNIDRKLNAILRTARESYTQTNTYSQKEKVGQKEKSRLLLHPLR
jgi:hypothetical protein